MELLFTSLLILLTLLVLTLIVINKSKQPIKRTLKQAPGPWSLPIAGSIHHLLFSRGLFHQTLRDLSAVYGPVMSLRLGQIPAVVISSTEAAREIMKTHDTTFASRPIYSSAAAIFYNGQNIAFSPYGEFWRNMRRLCTTELLTAKRIRSFLDLREEEVLRLLRAVEASSGTVVNLSAKLGTVSNDIMARAVIGSNCEEQKLFLSALGDAISVLNGFNAVDMFPSMPKFVSRVLGLRRKMERSAQNLDLNAEKIQRTIDY